MSALPCVQSRQPTMRAAVIGIELQAALVGGTGAFAFAQEPSRFGQVKPSQQVIAQRLAGFLQVVAGNLEVGTTLGAMR